MKDFHTWSEEMYSYPLELSLELAGDGIQPFHILVGKDFNPKKIILIDK